MTTLRDVLSGVSGLKPKVVDEIWEQVKANSARLDSCPGPHDFLPIEPDKPFIKHRCARCGGEVEGSRARWYKRGLERSGGR